MNLTEEFDLTYLTVDSLAEGVGSSQITPLISRLSKTGLKINLISFEKKTPQNTLTNNFNSLGVFWVALPFGSNGAIGGIERLNTLRRTIPSTRLIHARSDIPAVSGIASGKAPVLWDVRSLWADQKIMIQNSSLNKSLYYAYRGLESVAAIRSVGMSTLTSAVVPVLEERHKQLPSLRTVVPTAVDLDRFLLDLNMPVNFRALFSGTYNGYYDLKLSSLFMDEIRKHIKIEAHWARPFESETNNLGLGERLIAPANQIEMAQLIPNYSFGVSICKMNAGPSLTAAMPTKIGEFLACGRPVVVNKGLGDMDQFIAEYDAGVVLDGDLQNLAESAHKLISLITDPDTPNRCRALAEKHFSMDTGVENYLDLYSQILNSKN
jgi:hypothetical protein